VLRCRIALRAPVDLVATLAPLRVGRRDPTIRLSRNEAWRASWTPDGPATLRLAPDGCGIDATAWGPGAAWTLEHAPDLVGAGDSLDRFAPANPVIRDLHRRNPGLRLPRTGTVADVLVPTVLGQKVTAVEQHRSWERLVRRHGTPAPGLAGLMLPPHPDDLRALPYHRFHRLGVERRRSETIRFACSRAVRLEETLAMDAPGAMRRLTAFPGVGPWTAAIACRLSRGDPDAIEVGDYNLPRLVAWNLAGEPDGDDERMLELLAPYAGHRGRVLRLLTFGGDYPPRRGPRMAIRNFESF
jgi:3-methyladenine DNA glycosylase/8-oxoguanine DNA glycosylase